MPRTQAFCLFSLFSAALSLATSARAQDADPSQTHGDIARTAPPARVILQDSPKRDLDFHFNGEITLTLQHLFRFTSLYSGANSLRSLDETEVGHTYSLSIKKRVSESLTFYINPEIAWGNGISEGSGLSGGTNGDFLGQSVLRPDPYLARYYGKYHIWLRDSAKNEPAEVPISPHPGQLLFTFGKFAVNDIFDRNDYANDPRAQFSNGAFVNNLAMDYPQETRGYNLGLSAQWIEKRWAARFGLFGMPTAAGGPDLALNFDHDNSFQAELELHPRLSRHLPGPLVVRLQAFHSTGNLGRFQEALDAASPGNTPDVSSVRHRGSTKYGFGLNAEQELTDSGDTGAFLRYGWNDGAHESYALAEADRSLSFGVQISGKRWKRPNDAAAIAFAQADLSGVHRNYLAAGGTGLSVGDGALNYGSERTLEAYYAFTMQKNLVLTLDYQYISNPGYNRDRGPASVLGLRMHLIL